MEINSKTFECEFDYNYQYVKFKQLEGQTLTEIVGAELESERILFKTEAGKVYCLYHSQSCCESVYVDDIVGCIEDLLNTPILLAEEVVNESVEVDKWGSTATWSFYKIHTNRGDVTIKWFGESNGYYSETVDFVELTGKRR